MALTLCNREGRHRVVATALTLAMTRRARRHGLLGRDRLEPRAGLLLAPCLAIHTAFMRFPLDVAFVDRTGHVVKVAHRLRPWRIAAAARAHAVIELPAGTLRARDVRHGDRLFIRPDGETVPPALAAMLEEAS